MYHNNIPCVFEQAEDDEGLSVEIKTALFRICQEALLNISQHAGATEVTVIKKMTENNILLVICDNGKGFQKEQQKKSFGLIAIRERILALNGHLHIETEVGTGTKVSVSIPKN